MQKINVDGQVLWPSKVVCIGRNYVEHIEELNNEMPEQAVIFVKPNSAICNEIYSARNEVIHYEGELSFIIKSGQIQAVAAGLDLTKRAVQSKLKSKGLPWERAKAFDRSAVFSDFVSFKGGLENLSLQLFINDRLVQEANFSLMLYKPEQIINEVSQFMSFADGDILMAGTPKGVGEIIQGDHFTARVYSGEILLIDKTWVVK